MLVFVTKIDEYEPGLTGDLSYTFHSERLYKLVQVGPLTSGRFINNYIIIESSAVSLCASGGLH